MKLKFIPIIFIFMSSCFLKAQDTIFYKTSGDFVANVVTKGYHLLFTLEYKGVYYDSIMQYDYGAYYQAGINDINIINDYYYIFYEAVGWFGIIVFKLEGNNWTHIVGSPLRYLARSSAKIEAKIEEGGVIKLYETEKGASAPKVTTYVLDYVNKVITKQADK